MKTFNQFISEESEKEQTITMTVPFLIRVMEFAREEAKDDIQLHTAAEEMAEVKGVLDMESYEKIFGELK